MRRVEHLRAQPPKKRLQAMRRVEHLRAQTPNILQQAMQRVLRDLMRYGMPSLQIWKSRKGCKKYTLLQNDAKNKSITSYVLILEMLNKIFGLSQKLGTFLTALMLLPVAQANDIGGDCRDILRRHDFFLFTHTALQHVCRRVAAEQAAFFLSSISCRAKQPQMCF